MAGIISLLVIGVGLLLAYLGVYAIWALIFVFGFMLGALFFGMPMLILSGGMNPQTPPLIAVVILGMGGVFGGSIAVGLVRLIPAIIGFYGGEVLISSVTGWQVYGRATYKDISILVTGVIGAILAMAGLDIFWIVTSAIIGGMLVSYGMSTGVNSVINPFLQLPQQAMSGGLKGVLRAIAQIPGIITALISAKLFSVWFLTVAGSGLLVQLFIYFGGKTEGGSG